MEQKNFYAIYEMLIGDITDEDVQWENIPKVEKSFSDMRITEVLKMA